jgi:transcriptional regulator with XRE-family HTH domain
VTTLDRRVGRAIAAARHRAGMTQEALASEARLHSTYISQVERGLKSPTLRAFASIARALGVSPADLLRSAERDTALGAQ